MTAVKIPDADSVTVVAFPNLSRSLQRSLAESMIPMLPRLAVSAESPDPVLGLVASVEAGPDLAVDVEAGPALVRVASAAASPVPALG